LDFIFSYISDICYQVHLAVVVVVVLVDEVIEVEEEGSEGAADAAVCTCGLYS
jgi:hypothetical protein